MLENQLVSHALDVVMINSSTGGCLEKKLRASGGGGGGGGGTAVILSSDVSVVGAAGVASQDGARVEKRWRAVAGGVVGRGWRGGNKARKGGGLEFDRCVNSKFGDRGGVAGLTGGRVDKPRGRRPPGIAGNSIRVA